MKIRIQSLLMILCMGALVSSAAAATEIVRLSTRDMGKQSTLVVLGKVQGIRSRWNDKKTKIFTEISVSIDQSFKGSAPANITVTQLGGTVGTVQMHVHGALSWAPNEEVLLFLQPYGSERFQVSGFSQGKFSIARDPDSGELYVLGTAEYGANRAGKANMNENAASSTAAIGKYPLQAFLSEALADE